MRNAWTTLFKIDINRNPKPELNVSPVCEYHGAIMLGSARARMSLLWSNGSAGNFFDFNALRVVYTVGVSCRRLLIT